MYYKIYTIKSRAKSSLKWKSFYKKSFIFCFGVIGFRWLPQVITERQYTDMRTISSFYNQNQTNILMDLSKILLTLFPYLPSPITP